MERFCKKCVKRDKFLNLPLECQGSSSKKLESNVYLLKLVENCGKNAAIMAANCQGDSGKKHK